VLIFECIVVIGMAVIPDIVNALIAFVNSSHDSGNSLQHAASTATRSLRVILPLLFIMWRSGEPGSAFGLVRIRPIKDPLIGLLVYFASLAVFWATFSSMHSSPFGFRAMPVPDLAPGAAIPLSGWVYISVRSLTNGIAEELALRAFLQTRLERIWGSGLLAVFATTALAASYHVYGGLDAIYNAAIFNLAAGLTFGATRRFWPVAFAHMAGDFFPHVLW
jgi:membrane protease YdiL (CAAX protease family)